MLEKYLKKEKFFSKKSGFTLIELIITIAVFSIGILAAFSLALANSNENKSNRDRVIAANLARESLELVRNIRDSNWLKIDSNVSEEIDGRDFIISWDNGALENDFIVVDYNVYSEGLEICGSIVDLDDIDACYSNCKNYECSVFVDDNGFYTQDFSSNYLRTNFSRFVKLERICMDDSDLISPVETIREECLEEEEKIGLKATAIVNWQRAGKEHSLQLSDKLYNWRR